MLKILLGILAALAGLLVLAWLGLQVKPSSFAPYDAPAAQMETVPLPEDLPEPVRRYYLEIYGERVPVIHSAVVSGKATMRISGIVFPSRFRFTHIAGQGYRHYIESALYGFPIMKVNETYLDGQGRLELPFGVFEGEQINQSANLGLWAESMWLPAIFLTDPRVSWEAVDEETAILVVPFDGDETQRFVVRFDADTGLMTTMESMRYRDAEGGGKVLWLNVVQEWGQIDGAKLPVVGAATWLDEGTPWAVFTLEEVVYNSDVSEYIRATGP